MITCAIAHRPVPTIERKRAHHELYYTCKSPPEGTISPTILLSHLARGMCCKFELAQQSAFQLMKVVYVILELGKILKVTLRSNNDIGILKARDPRES